MEGACLLLPVPKAHSLQDAHGRRGLPLEALADVVGVGARAVLEQHLPRLAGTRQVLQQVLHLVGGAGGGGGVRRRRWKRRRSNQSHGLSSVKRPFWLVILN